MTLNEHMGDLPKTFRFVTGSPYDFGETKRILLALTRLVDRDAKRIDWSLKCELRVAYRAICEAAEQIESDLDNQLRMALYEADENTADRVLCERMRKEEADGPWTGIGDRIAAVRHALSAVTVDRKWRDTLLDLRDNKVTLREAIRSHSSVRYALLSGFLSLRNTPSHNKAIRKVLQTEISRRPSRSTRTLIQQELLSQGELQLLSSLGRRWLHLLEQSARVRRLAITIILGDPIFKSPGGRREEREIKRFTRRLVEICREFSGRRPTTTLFTTSMRGAKNREERASAGILLLEACLNPLGYIFIWERCKELLLEALKLKP